MSLHAVVEEIKRIKNKEPESILYGVWNSILNFQFPVQEGYITRPQDEHTSQSGEKGYSDLHTFHYSGESSTADKFLIVQCKRAGFETRSSVWIEGVGQLNRYLAATHGTRRVSDRSPVYGIVAIGKSMRVYKYDDDSQSVDDWSPGATVEAGEVLDLVEHEKKIQRVLNHIRRYH
jgi:hypothetical protein